MFNKEDYLQFIDELYQIEKGMEKEGRELLRMIDNNEEANMILNTLIKDEMRHQKIVQEMRKLID